MPHQDDVVLTVEQLTAILDAIADSYGMTAAERSAWIEHCVLAELRGNIMQSLAYLEYHWIQRFDDGRTTFGAEIEVLRETPAMGVLDAHGAIGPYAGKWAVDWACRKAKVSGACVATMRNSNDWMMISYATRQALAHDCIALAFVNSRPEVAPWGATTAVYGMNPLSVAIPTERHHPILVDMSSHNSGGVAVQERLVRGAEVPEGLLIDDKGEAITDGRAWGTYMGGWGMGSGAQRMSGYRDLALAVVTDSLGGALSGMGTALQLATPEPAVDGRRTPRGQVVVVLDVDQFTPLAEFKEKVDRAIDEAKAAPLAPGFDEVVMPGERGFREEERRRREGIPLLAPVWDQVVRVCEQRGLDAQALVAGASQGARR